jgi:PAS domain S-box-containing protein
MVGTSNRGQVPGDKSMQTTAPSRRWHRLVPLLPLFTAAVLLGGVGLAVERTVGSEFERRALARVRDAAWLYADQASRQLARRVAEMRLFIADTGMQPGAPPAERRAALERLKAASPTYFWIGYVTPDGVVQAATGGLLEGVSIAGRPVFERSKAGLWVGSPHPVVALRQPLAERGIADPGEVADLGMPVFDVQGRLRAVLAVHLGTRAMGELREVVLGTVENRQQLALTILDETGRPMLGEAIDPAWRSALGALAADVGHRVRDGPADRLMAHSHVRAPAAGVALDWRVLAQQPRAAALAPAELLVRQLGLISVGVALLAGGAGVWLSRRLSRPLLEQLDALAARRGDEAQLGWQGMAEQLRLQPARLEGLSAGERLIRQLLLDAGRLQQVLGELPSPVLLLDVDERVSYLNAAAERAFGWPAAEALGLVLDEVAPPVSPTERAAFREQVSREAGPWRFVARSHRRDGATLLGEWHLSRVAGHSRAQLGWLLVVRDLTERHEAEQRRREQAALLSGIVDSASDAIVSVDPEGRITLFNPAAERTFGREAAAMLGQTLDPLLPPAERSQHVADLQRFAHSHLSRRAMGSGLVRGLRADGSECQLEASISHTTVNGRLVLTAILRDVTERVKADEALARTRTELAALAQRLLAQEKETTRRLAQVLHDGLGQTLVAARLTSDALMSALQGAWPAGQGARAQRLASLVDTAQSEVRSALVALRPPLLEDDGLAVALDTEVRSRIAGADGLRLECQVAPSARRQRWPADVEYAAFMVAREAVVNAILHSAGRSVTVELQGDAGELALHVDDDGIGFEAGQAPGPGHLGLVGMRERALAVRATVRVLRREAGGTRVSFEWQSGD